MAGRSDPNVSVLSFESEGTLREFLRGRSSRSILLGHGADSRREFFGLEVASVDPLPARIGIESVGGGVKPGFVLRGDHLWIGFNDRVALLALEPLHLVAEVELLSLFWTFLEMPNCSQVVVLGETAIVAISPEGVVQWRVDTDLITDFALKANTLTLQLSDAPSIEVDLLSGAARVQTR